MGDTRRKDWNWNTGETVSWDGAQLAVLMDIRDELKRLNSLLSCYRFKRLPDDIQRIDRRLERNGFRLTGPRRKRKKP